MSEAPIEPGAEPDAAPTEDPELTPPQDPGLAPDPEHEVVETPPEGNGPMRSGEDDE